MSSWLTIDRQCNICEGVEYAVLIERAERDGEWDCPFCEEGKMRHNAFLTAPVPMNAARPDGNAPQSMKDLARSYRLEAEAADLAPEKRGEYRKEISRLRSTKK